MARPLRYDDQFVSIINQSINDKFLNLCNIKVQSTAFCQKINLQKALTIISCIDFILGFVIFISFFEIIGYNDHILYFIENTILVFGMFFGLLGIDAATNLKKQNSAIYKNWRILVTFLVPLLELINKKEDFCYYKTSCRDSYFWLMTFVYIIVNLYLTKIAWSFCIRINRNHELLIIHGKHLEKMMKDENFKMSDNKKYIPPDLQRNMKIIQHEKEMINLVNSPAAIVEEETFAPKEKPNIFFKAMNKTNLN